MPCVSTHCVEPRSTAVPRSTYPRYDARSPDGRSHAPSSATADDGAWDLPSGDRASYLGYVDLGTAVDLGSTQWVETHGINKALKLSGTGVFGYLTNITTLTPAAVAHIVTLHAVPL